MGRDRVGGAERQPCAGSADPSRVQGPTNVYEKGMFSPTEETVSVTLDFALEASPSAAGRQMDGSHGQSTERGYGDIGAPRGRRDHGSINRITGVASFGSPGTGFSIFQRRLSARARESFLDWTQFFSRPQENSFFVAVGKTGSGKY